MTINEKIESILKMWDTDSTIDPIDPSQALLDTPKLHSKYVGIMTEYKIKIRSVEHEIKRLKKVKWEYYNGRLEEKTLQELGWEPFPYILKSDISLYLESDEDLCKLQAKKGLFEELVNVCALIIKELNSRTFQLKAYIDYQKFVSGN